MSKFIKELQTKLCSEKVKELLDNITINSTIMNALDERDLLKQRINKAIEYINKLEFEEYGVLYDNGSSILEYEHDFKDNLLEILKGGSNESNI